MRPGEVSDMTFLDKMEKTIGEHAHFVRLESEIISFFNGSLLPLDAKPVYSGQIRVWSYCCVWIHGGGSLAKWSECCTSRLCL